MSVSADKVRSEALALSISERASLAHDLILSLDEPSDFELSSEREAEIARRVQMVQDRTVVGRPASQVFTGIKAKFGK